MTQVLENERARKRRKMRSLRREYWQVLEAFKVERGCADCGTREGQLDFHHVLPETKCFNISQGHHYSKARQAAELAKCVVVCALCHAERHRVLRSGGGFRTLA